MVRLFLTFNLQDLCRFLGFLSILWTDSISECLQRIHSNNQCWQQPGSSLYNSTQYDARGAHSVQSVSGIVRSQLFPIQVPFQSQVSYCVGLLVHWCLAERMAPKRSKAGSSTDAPPKEWEMEDPEWQQESEGEGTEPQEDDEEDDPSDTEVGPSDAQHELLSFLLGRHQQGKLTAKDMCIISFWCGRAGLKQVGTLGMRPKSSSGNHQRHVDGFLKKHYGQDMPDAYLLPMPTHHRASGERCVHDLPVLPPHELLAKEMQGADVGALLDGWRKTPNFDSHPVVVNMAARATNVVPLALYLDVASYAVRDSMLIVSVTNLLTDKQHVVAVLRKRMMCGLKAGCGCKGWCSLHILWCFLRWSLQALSEATYPSCRHHSELDADKLNDAGWRKEDAPRQASAGTPMPFAGAVLQLRADWGEMATRLGLANWSTWSDPCFLCSCNRGQMLDREALTKHDAGLAWPLRTAAGYEADCRRCEVFLDVTTMSELEWEDVKSALVMDVRKEGVKGLALNRAFPRFGLKRGDRVEPSMHLMDWQTLYKRKPQGLLFWRQSAETSVRRRNPLFQESLHTHVTSSFAIDVMHSWCLGIFQQFVVAVLWKVLDSNLFPVQSRPGPGKEDKRKKCLKLVVKDLLSWYKSFRQEHPETALTPVNDLTLEMLGGSETKQILKCKAHETLGLLRYLVSRLPQWKDELDDGPLWDKAALRLLRLWTNLDKCDVVLTEFQQEADLPHMQKKTSFVFRTRGTGGSICSKLKEFKVSPLKWVQLYFSTALRCTAGFETPQTHAPRNNKNDSWFWSWKLHVRAFIWT